MHLGDSANKCPTKAMQLAMWHATAVFSLRHSIEFIIASIFWYHCERINVKMKDNHLKCFWKWKIQCQSQSLLYFYFILFIYHKSLKSFEWFKPWCCNSNKNAKNWHISQFIDAKWEPLVEDHQLKLITTCVNFWQIISFRFWT